MHTQVHPYFLREASIIAYNLRAALRRKIMPDRKRVRTTMPDSRDSHPPIAFHWDISLGQVLYAIVILVGVIVWALTQSSKADTAYSGMQDLKNTVTQQISDLRRQLDTDVATIGTQIGALPDYAARLNVTEKHAANVDATISQINASVRDIEEKEIQMRTELDDLERASGMRLRH